MIKQRFHWSRMILQPFFLQCKYERFFLFRWQGELHPPSFLACMLKVIKNKKSLIFKTEY